MDALTPETAALYGLREAVARLLISAHRSYPRFAALPYEVRAAFQGLMQAMAAPWFRVLSDLREGDVILLHVPPGETPQVIQEAYARICNAVPPGVRVLTETSGLYLEHIPAQKDGDVILIRMRKRPDPEEQVALGHMTRMVFGGTPTVIVQDDSHDVFRFNEAEMKQLGWVRER